MFVVPNSVSVHKHPLSIDGVNYDCLQWPGTKTPALLCLHGLGDAPDSYCALGEDSRRSQQLISFSFRGTCGSDPLPPGIAYSRATLGEDIIKVLDHFRVEEVVLLAASFSGLAAIQVASQDRHRVKGLVLVDSLPKVDPRAVDSARRRLSGTWNDYATFAEDFAKSNGTTQQEATPLIATRARREFGVIRYRIDARLLELLTTKFYNEFEEPAKEIKCPVLCLRSGLQSVVPPEAWSETKNLIPTAEVTFIEDARHSIMRSKPQAFNDALFSFLGKL